MPSSWTTSTSPGACSAVSWVRTPRSTPTACSRGPMTASPPVTRRSTTDGTWGATSARREPSGSILVTPTCPGPVPRRTVSASAFPRPRLHSRGERRRAAPASVARSGCAASAARMPARTASASRFCASRSSRAWAAASVRPARRPERQVATATALTRAGRRAGRRLRGAGEGDLDLRPRRGRSPGRSQPHPAAGPGAASADAAPPGPATTTARRPHPQHRPRRPAHRSLVQVPAVQPAAVRRRQVGDGDLPSTDVHRDVAAGDVRVLELDRGLAAPAQDVPALTERDGPTGVGSAHDVQLQGAGADARRPARHRPPDPSTAPCASSGAVSGVSSRSRVDPAHTELAPGSRPSWGMTSPSDASSAAVTSTSAAPPVPVPVPSDESPAPGGAHGGRLGRRDSGHRAILTGDPPSWDGTRPTCGQWRSAHGSATPGGG